CDRPLEPGEALATPTRCRVVTREIEAGLSVARFPHPTEVVAGSLGHKLRGGGDRSFLLAPHAEPAKASPHSHERLHQNKADLRLLGTSLGQLPCARPMPEGEVEGGPTVFGLAHPAVRQCRELVPVRVWRPAEQL